MFTRLSAAAAALVLFVIPSGSASSRPNDAAAPQAAPAALALTLPNKADSLKFAVLGDFGTGSRQQYELAAVMKRVYDAFPYERFGQYRGSINDIGRNVWTPGERIGTLVAKEPVYRVDVGLERQAVAALGQEYALRPGMAVNADLLLEKRTILEWIFEPVLQLKGRL